jgi:hypothetical protein
MLFDLRGRHRRRLVRLIYTGLALLMGVGLVGFGVGGGFSGGGILNAAGSGEGGGGSSFADQIKKYTKITNTQPNNLSAWEKLTKALLHEAGQEGYVTTTGYTTKGKELVTKAGLAWERYLALNPPKPNTELAQLVTNYVYVEGGVSQPNKAVEALQILVAAKPESAALYARLAEAAYKAKNARVGDLASTKAVELALPAQRASVKSALEAVKKNPTGTGAAGSGETYTTTTNGKTYTGKLGSGGTFTGTVAKTTTTPAGTSSGKTSSGKTSSTTTTTKK